MYQFDVSSDFTFCVNYTSYLFIDRHMYRCARASEWGDRLPLQYEQQQENLEDDTTNKTTDVE